MSHFSSNVNPYAHDPKLHAEMCFDAAEEEANQRPMRGKLEPGWMERFCEAVRES